MGKLTGQTIADSYDQLLIVDHADGISSSLQAVESADTGGSSSALSISTVAISVAGNATITTADNTDTLTLISTDADAGSGPNLRMYRNSGSPANDDVIGQIDFEGKNNAGSPQDVVYATLKSYINDRVDSSEAGMITAEVMNGSGSLAEAVRMHNVATVFNEGGADRDFRVEGVSAANALFVQGSNGNVGIGIAAPDNLTHIYAGDASQTSNTSFTQLTVENSGHSGIGILSGTNSYGTIYFGDDGSTSAGILQYGHGTNGDSLSFGTAGSIKMTISSSGNLVISTPGGGIDFSANTDDEIGAGSVGAEILDDYEEGTWTAGMSDGSTPMTMDDETGYYTKVGNLVTVSGYLKSSSLNGLTSETIRITGLPFTIADNNAAYSCGTGYGGGFAIPAGQTVSFYGQTGQSYIVLQIWNAATGTAGMTAAQWTADGRVMIGLSYRAA